MSIALLQLQTFYLCLRYKLGSNSSVSVGTSCKCKFVSDKFINNTCLWKCVFDYASVLPLAYKMAQI